MTARRALALSLACGLAAGCTIKDSRLQGPDRDADRDDPTTTEDEEGFYDGARNRVDAAPLEVSDASLSPSGSLDEDGVLMILPPDPNGASWRLGESDPNEGNGLFDMNGSASRNTEGPLTFWTTQGGKVNYSSGGSGRTIRLNITAGGGSQKYTWKNGALEHGYLGSPRDLKNLEATAYVRVHRNLDNHDSFSWKIRGGKHTGDDDPRSSCVGLGIPYGKGKPRAARELDHPNYDYIELPAAFDYSVQDNVWVAVKIVSYNLDAQSVMNRLYLDTDPFDENGKPRNDFRLYTEWIDRTGESSGKYKQAAVWGGWVNTLRIDGWDSVDFAILSARAILPPSG